MKTAKILEMLDYGRIDELKELLKDELFAESLKNNPSSRKRYMAMKRYFTYVNNSGRECLQKPCKIDYDGKPYTCFTNSWSLVLTTEDTGEIELFDTTTGVYPNVTKLIRFDGIKKKIDFNRVIAEAKSKGYKLTKNEVGAGFKYVMRYDDTFYKIGLIDMSYRIIDDGTEAMTYHPYGEKMPLTIENDIGCVIIMPVFVKDKEDFDETHIIIEVN